jgi:hypothetical protein
MYSSWPEATPQHVDLDSQRLCTCKVRQVENMLRPRVLKERLPNSKFSLLTSTHELE